MLNVPTLEIEVQDFLPVRPLGYAVTGLLHLEICLVDLSGAIVLLERGGISPDRLIALQRASDVIETVFGSLA